MEQPREHSRKPDVARENIVKICGDIPRVELFARQTTDGWDCWGNQVGLLNLESLNMILRREYGESKGF